MSCKICNGKLPIRERWFEGSSNIVEIFNGELIVKLTAHEEYPRWVSELLGELSICKEINYCPCCGQQLDDGLVTDWG